MATTLSINIISRRKQRNRAAAPRNASTHRQQQQTPLVATSISIDIITYINNATAAAWRQRKYQRNKP